MLKLKILLVRSRKFTKLQFRKSADKKRRFVEFEGGDFVWVVLTKDRFPVGEYNKLPARKIGPLEIMEKTNPNAYQLLSFQAYQDVPCVQCKHLVPYTRRLI
jgi:hypothetical protein